MGDLDNPLPSAKASSSLPVKGRTNVHRSASMSGMSTTRSAGLGRSSSVAMMRGSSDSNNNDSNGGASNIQVAVRCRPLNNEEKKVSQTAAIACDIDTNTVRVIGKKTTKSAEFDRVFGVYSRQSEVYDSMVRPIVEEMLSGFNCTVFAYGPTGTGKTYTMAGSFADEESWGMIPRAAKTIFECLRDSSRFDFNLKVSFLEIYNEELRDLLSPTAGKRLQLQEDLNKTVVCKNLEEFSIASVESCMEFIRRGILNRQTGMTLSNANSSRSHAIFTFRLVVRETIAVGEEVVRIGQLNLVDLAGSECIGISGSKGDMAVEAGKINQSLLTLGRVINALVDFHLHVPYRDSKLTRLLQESLGGKAKTCIIATLSPAQAQIDESVSTLEYAARARSVKNNPTQNTSTSAKAALKDVNSELEMLKQQLILTRERNGIYVDPKEYEDTQFKLATQKAALTECEATIIQRDKDLRSALEERNNLIDQLSQVQAQRDQLENDLALMTNKYNDAQLRLASTFVNLQVTQTIAQEQAQTESLLQQHKTQLHETVADRDSDISLLVHKCRQLQKHSETQLLQTEAYSSGLQVQHSQLLSSANTLGTQALELKKSLDIQVEQTRQQANIAAASIMTAMSLLLTELNSQNSSFNEKNSAFIETALNALQTAHAQVVKVVENNTQQGHLWLDNASSATAGLKNTLAVQQASQITSLSNKLTAEFQALQSQLAVFSTLQETRHRDALTAIRSFRSDLEAHCDRYIASTAVQATETKARLVHKANLAEQAVMQILRALQSDAEEEVMNMASVATDALTRSKLLSQDGSRTLETRDKDAHTRCISSIDALTAWGKDTSRAFETSVVSIDQSRASAVDFSEGLSVQITARRGAIEREQKAIITSLDTLRTDAQTSFTTTKERSERNHQMTVEQTTKMSAALTRETEKMSASISAETNRIKDSVKQGQEAFTALSESQKALNETAVSQSVTFLDTTRTSRLARRGDTPMQTPDPLPAVDIKTRPVQEIKEEIVSVFQRDDKWREELPMKTVTTLEELLK